MKSINPQLLKKGDTIGIISVANADAYNERGNFDRGVEVLKSRGYKVKLGSHVLERKGYKSGTPKDLASDLNAMFGDKDIQGIICAGGGINANALLPYIDFEQIKRNPKLLMGVSNPTILLNAINKKTGLKTFHGPAIVWDLGNADGFNEFTAEQLWSALEKRADLYIDKSAVQVHRDGQGQGEIVAGHLTTIQGLLGTQYEPKWDNNILFWEEVFDSTDNIEMRLTHFKNAGVFDKINGMVVGELLECDESILKLDDLLDEVTEGYRFPVLKNLPFGHTSKKYCLPVGGLAEINTKDNICLRIKMNEVR